MFGRVKNWRASIIDAWPVWPPLQISICQGAGSDNHVTCLVAVKVMEMCWSGPEMLLQFAIWVRARTAGTCMVHPISAQNTRSNKDNKDFQTFSWFLWFTSSWAMDSGHGTRCFFVVTRVPLHCCVQISCGSNDDSVMQNVISELKQRKFFDNVISVERDDSCTYFSVDECRNSKPDNDIPSSDQSPLKKMLRGKWAFTFGFLCVFVTEKF